jgi:TonB family protein
MAVVRHLASIAVVIGCLAAPLIAQDAQQPYRAKDPGIVLPVVVKHPNPRYTDEAREKKIQGMVQLDAVVLEDGTVGEVTVTKSLDDTYGLDQAAVAALKQWLFKPGQKDGKPVPVLVTVEMSFTLK